MIKLVVDANIFFSIMKPDSVASHIFSSLRATFFAPEYIKHEIEEHKSECISKSELSDHEFEIRLAEVEEGITFCNLSEYKIFLKEAIYAVPDSEDSPYIALALALKTAIWSNDLHFRQQSLIKVFTTRELISKLLKDEL